MDVLNEIRNLRLRIAIATILLSCLTLGGAGTARANLSAPLGEQPGEQWKLPEEGSQTPSLSKTQKAIESAIPADNIPSNLLAQTEAAIGLSPTATNAPAASESATATPNNAAVAPSIDEASSNNTEEIVVASQLASVVESLAIDGPSIAPNAESTAVRAIPSLEKHRTQLAQTPLPGQPAPPETEQQPERLEDLTPPSRPVSPITPSAPSVPPSSETPVIPVPPPSGTQAAPAPSPQVLVAELAIDGTQDPELLNEIYRVISTRAGRPTTRTILQEDVNQIFATGYFSNVTVLPEDTPLGVRITFQVEPNPVLNRVVIQTVPQREGQGVLSQEKVDEIFENQYGKILNLRRFQAGILRLNDWYKEQGYDLAQVVGAPEVGSDGTVTLVVAEGNIEDIRVRFFNDENEPVDGVTRPFIVTREIQLKPGDVFNRQTAQRDLERVFGLGIFDDVKFSFSPGSDPSKVIVNVDVNEASTGSVAAGAGISSASGFFGTASYQQKNVGGNNQTLSAEAQLGTREFLFDLSFTDPWIATHPNRLSYTLNAFRRRSISLIFDEGNPDIRLPNGDRPRIVRTGGGITFGQPLGGSPFEQSPWYVSAGLDFQGVSVEDSRGDRSPRDELGNLLSFSDSGKDQMLALHFGASQDLRNNPFQPTSGSLLRLAMDQTIPVGSGNILMSRLRASYSYYLPVEFTNFTPGPEALAFNVQGGTVFGDLPPYEAFAIGGANSVRGYTEGGVGSGRSYLQLTAEYRFPLFTVSRFGVGGALFVDYGTDLGTGSNVPGKPAVIRNKPGDGLGYGLGVRVQSPLGPIRIDYGFNVDGGSRFHFGIGERF